MTKTSNFWQNVFHVVVQGIVWLGPVAILNLGSIGNFTISGVLSLGVMYLKDTYLSGKQI